MVQFIRVIIPLVITVISLSGYAKAQDWAVDEFYRDTPEVMILKKTAIDLKFKKEESNGIEYKEKEKTLGEDFHEFLKENLYTYTMLWSLRVVYDPENVQAVFTPSSFPKWINNINGWQGCNGKAASRGRCSVRKPFTAFPLWDGDYVKTNLIQHPIFGAGTYLYYRARGYDRAASSLASFGVSALYEYTVEGWMQPPSITDLLLTPGIGVPLGIVMEETSNLLAGSDNQFIKGLSYAVNPARVFIPDGQISWNLLLGRTIAFQFSW